MNALDAYVCYILCFPDAVERSGEPLEQIRGLKDAPYFQPVEVAVRMLEQAEVQVRDVPVSVSKQRYDDQVQVIECKFPLANVLAPSAIPRREAIEEELLSLLIPAPYRESGLYEEYIVLMINSVNDVNAFVEANGRRLAHFIRTQREPLDDAEVQDILISRVHYSRNDLTIVDWDGAIIFAPEGDFQSDIELLKIGNYQLLRYRALDQKLSDSLRNIAEQFRHNPRRALRPISARRQIQRIVQHRLELMLDFDRTDQNLLLIGDWYTAKLYEIIREELYLDHWKDAVRAKLDNLENIIATIQENFSLSWSGLMSQVELVGWIILLIGYFVLFFIDAGWVK